MSPIRFCRPWWWRREQTAEAQEARPKGAGSQCLINAASEGGKQVAVVFGHGPEVGDYRLYDVKTGKLVSEVWGDADTQSLKTDAPDWAKRLQDHLDNNPTASP